MEFRISNENLEDIEILLQSDRSIKAITLVNPNFPFGKYIDSKVMQRLIDLAEKYQIYLVIDEAYSQVVIGDINYNEKCLPINSEYLIKIRTFSKTLTLSGVRLGYILSNRSMAKKLATLNEYTIGNPPTWTNPLVDLLSLTILEQKSNRSSAEILNQIEYSDKKNKIVKPFLNRTEEFYKDTQSTNQKLKKSLKLVTDLLDSTSLITYLKPEAGINVGIQIFKTQDDIELMKEIFLNTGVVLTPGSVFSIVEEYPWFRLTFALEPNKLVVSLKKVVNYIEKR